MRALAIAVLLFQVQRTGENLRIVDDQGTELKSSLRVCFGVENGEACIDKAPYARPLGFVKWLSIEGPLHGPVSFDPFPAITSIVVPRKAQLRVSRRGTSALNATLYGLQDHRLRRPQHSLPIPPAGDLAIPSGQWLLSITTHGMAPDLHVVNARPGAVVPIAATLRQGWSLALICTMPGRETPTVPAPHTLVRLLVPPPRPTEADVIVLRASTNEQGIAVFSGITSPIVAVEAERVGLVTARVGGISGTSGTFSVREVRLDLGGTVRAAVRDLDGRGIPGTCQLLEPVPTSTVDPRPRLRQLGEVVRPERGVCAIGPVRSGDAVFRFRGEDGKRWDEAVTIVAGQDTDLSVSWSDFSLHGTVTRAGSPVSGATVKVVRQGPGLPKDEEACTVGTTDDAGEYRVKVPQDGRYRAMLTLAEVPVAMEEVEIHQPERELDFTLNPASVDGTVVDQSGRPVADAVVSLNLAQAYRSARSSATGNFSFPVSTAGRGFVLATKAGYEPSPQSEFVLTDVPLPPIQLLVKRRDTLLGRILRADSTPAAGVPLLSVEPGSGTVLQFGESAADGTFELARAPGGETRIFTAGPACGLCSRTIGSSDAGPTDISCPAATATLDLTLQDSGGRPLQREAILVAIGGVAFPSRLLQLHLASLGVAALTDATGRISLAGLDPGHIAAFLARAASERSIAANMANGLLVGVDLTSGETSEHVVTVRIGPPSP